MGVFKPTEIQLLAIPHVLQGQNTIIHSSTGTGKTFAYVLPIITRIAEVIDEKKLSYNYLQVEKRSIKILILAPSRELVAQIYETFLSFLPHILPENRLPTNFVQQIVGGKSHSMQYQRFYQRPPYVLIATPKTLLALHQKSKIDFSHVETIVLDEVDSMIPPISTYSPVNRLKNYERHPKPAEMIMEEVMKATETEKRQAILVSATINTWMRMHARNKWMNAKKGVVYSRARYDVPKSIDHYACLVDSSDKVKIKVVANIFDTFFQQKYLKPLKRFCL